MMNLSFGEPVTALGGEDIQTRGVAAAHREIGVQRATRIVHKIQVAQLAAFVSNADPADFGTNMGIIDPEPGTITHVAAGPIAQGKDRFTARSTLPFDQGAQDKALLRR
jgi:hypothetical protein